MVISGCLTSSESDAMLGSSLLKELLKTACSNGDSPTVYALLLITESLISEVSCSDDSSDLF